jgi:hypothetical protein
MTVSNMVCEGLCPGLFRIKALQIYENFVVRDVEFPDGLNTGDIGLEMSFVPKGIGYANGI